MARIKSQKGVSLYLALAILTILLAIALGVSAIFLGQTRTLTAIGFSVTAFYAADTGIERELYEKNYQTEPAGFTYSEVLDLDGDGGWVTICPDNLSDKDDACYKVTILGSNNVRSDGYYNEVRRAIEIIF